MQEDRHAAPAARQLAGEQHVGVRRVEGPVQVVEAVAHLGTGHRHVLHHDVLRAADATHLHHCAGLGHVVQRSPA